MTSGEDGVVRSRARLVPPRQEVPAGVVFDSEAPVTCLLLKPRSASDVGRGPRVPAVSACDVVSADR